jgi:salicylate hydroxylase
VLLTKTLIPSQDPLKPSITLSNGQEIKADVVIGADGIHSLAAEAILGRKVQAVPPIHSNYCYRFLLPVEQLEADPETRFFTKNRDGWIRLFIDNNDQRRLVVYPCRE